jgi:AraC-like DNA-binding protein
VIDDILDCPYDEATSAFYYDVKIREYFYLLIKDCIHSREVKYRFTPYEIDQIHLARELLLSDLTTPPFTVRQLARKVSLNELKLKVGFTHFFRTSVFDCFQRARLYNARQQVLQTNKPLKEIGSLAGYRRTPNFITAFRKFYGYTPGALRR